MSTPGERLRSERLRLGLSQDAFGAIGGVRKQAQIKYEKGERRPNTEYLAAIAAAGVDVDYVLTGTSRALREALQDVKVVAEMSRSLGDSPEELVANQTALFEARRDSLEGERRLIASFRACLPDDRVRILELAERLQQQAPIPKRKSTRS